jgi:hypothetical protein
MSGLEFMGRMSNAIFIHLAKDDNNTTAAYPSVMSSLLPVLNPS